MHEESSTPEVVYDFLVQYHEDRASGRDVSLAEYQARFPGCETALAREFEALRDAAATAELARPAVDAQIGPYRVVRTLGRGGQGTVYLAEDTRLSRHVALKVLSSPLGFVSAQRRARFRREAESIARLDHPGICSIYEAELDGDAPYLAMRFVAGRTLASVLDERSRDREPTSRGLRPVCFPTKSDELRELLEFFERAARALHAAHEAGVIHRDIKPSNLMVGDDGQPVLLDFGLARPEDDGESTLTLTGEMFGTPAYMAPEVVAGRSSGNDRRSDVYALGVTLFEALTLAPPFAAHSREALFRAIRDEPVPRLRRRNPHAPHELQIVVETALEKDPERRYATALDCAEDLRRVRMHEPIRARAASLLTRARRALQRHPVLTASTLGVFAVLCVSLAFTVVLLVRGERERRARQSAFDRYQAAWYRNRSTQDLRRDSLSALGSALESLRLDRSNESRQAVLAALGAPLPATLRPFEESISSSQAARAGSACVFATQHTVPWLDLDSGEASVLWSDPQDVVTSVVVRADGGRVAVGTLSGRVLGIDPRGGRVQWNVAAHRDGVLGLQFTSDGSRVVSVAFDGLLCVTDADVGRSLGRLPVTRDSLAAVELTHDDRFAVAHAISAWDVRVLSDSFELHVVDLDRLEVLRSWRAHDAMIARIALDARGERVLSASRDRTARIWSLRDGTLLGEVRRNGGVRAAAFSSDGERIGIAWDPEGPFDTGAGLWSGRDYSALAQLGGHEFRAVNQIEFCPTDDDLVATCGNDEAMRVWDARDGRAVRVCLGAVGFGPYMTWTPDGVALIGTRGGAVSVWPLSTPCYPIVLAVGDGPLERAQFHPRDPDSLLAASRSGSLSVWRVPEGVVLRRFSGATSPLVDARYTAAGERVVTTHRDGLVRTWDVRGGTLERELAGHTGEIVALALDGTGRVALTGARDGTARVWDVASGRCTAILDHGGATPGALAIAPDGSWIASGDDDRTMRAWPAPFGGPARVAHRVSEGGRWAEEVTAVCFSSDASELVGSFECDRVVKFDLERLAPAGSFEAGVHLRTWFDPTRARLIAASRWRGWIESLDLATGSRVQSRLSPTSANTALELSPSRALAVTAARDGSVILWSLDGLKEIVVHRAHDGVATDASFSADERWIASSGWDGRVVVLPVDIEGVALAALPAGFDPESVDANDPSVRR